MANLDARIAVWRLALEAEIGDAERVAELEEHLRDALQERLRAGETPEQVLEQVLAQLGSPRALAAEFAKVAAPVPWLPARLVLTAGGLVAALLIGMATLSFARSRGGDPLLMVHIVTIALGYTAALLVGALATCYLLARPLGPLPPGQTRFLMHRALLVNGAGLLLTVVGVLLGGWWASGQMGRFWDWDPREIGGLAVVFWQALVLLLLWYRPSAALPAMLLAIFGNVVVSLAWFGPPLFSDGLNNLHAHGSNQSALLLLALFVVSQLAIACIGLQPAGWLRRARG
jgi:ABC-type transport system involved in cytochrome c biogenesis permease subunit